MPQTNSENQTSLNESSYPEDGHLGVVYTDNVRRAPLLSRLNSMYSTFGASRGGDRDNFPNADSFKKRGFGAVVDELCLFRKNHWMSSYSWREHLMKDMLTGLLLGVVLVPQGLSYGLLAELPAYYGLYACLAAPVLYAFFGSSNELCLGPFSIVSILVADSVGKIVDPGDVGEVNQEYIDAVVTVTFMVGVILMLFSVFRLGQLINFLSMPVLSALTTAGSILTATSQMKHFLGVSYPDAETTFHAWYNVFKGFSKINWVTFAIGVSCVILQVFIEFCNSKSKFLKNRKIVLPSALLSLVFAISLVIGFDLDGKHDVRVLGKVPSGLPHPEMPSGFAHAMELLPSAFVIALVGFSLSFATGKTLMEKRQRIGYVFPPNKELFAHGIANLVGSFFLSYPTFGSLSRSSIAFSENVKSPAHNLFSASFIATTLLLLTRAPILDRLPFAALAAVIMFSLRKLLKQLLEVPKLFKTDFGAFSVWMVTCLCVLWLDIAMGCAAGVLFSFLLLIRSVSKPPYAVLGQVDLKEPIYRDVKRFPQAREIPEAVIIRFDASLHFANIDHFEKRINKVIARRKHVKFVILDAGAIVDVDYSAFLGLTKVSKELKTRGLMLIICHAKWRLRDILDKKGLDVRRFLGIRDAIEFVKENSVIAVEGSESDTLSSNEDSGLDSCHKSSVSEDDANQVLDMA